MELVALRQPYGHAILIRRLISGCVWTAQDLLEPWEGTRVLHWRGFEPGAFGGYERREQNAAFDKVYFQLTYFQGWCDQSACHFWAGKC